MSALNDLGRQYRRRRLASTPGVSTRTACVADGPHAHDAGRLRLARDGCAPEARTAPDRRPRRRRSRATFAPRMAFTIDLPALGARGRRRVPRGAGAARRHVWPALQLGELRSIRRRRHACTSRLPSYLAGQRHSQRSHSGRSNSRRRASSRPLRLAAATCPAPPTRCRGPPPAPGLAGDAAAQRRAAPPALCCAASALSSSTPRTSRNPVAARGVAAQAAQRPPGVRARSSSAAAAAGRPRRRASMPEPSHASARACAPLARRWHGEDGGSSEPGFSFPGGSHVAGSVGRVAAAAAAGGRAARWRVRAATGSVAAVQGEEAPTFRSLGCHALEARRNAWASPGRACAGRGIPRILSGQSVVVQSSTGSGKTLSFLLPALCARAAARARPSRSRRRPSRELATQTAAVLHDLADRFRHLSGTPPRLAPRPRSLADGAIPAPAAEVLVGGEQLGAAGADEAPLPSIVVATPARLSLSSTGWRLTRPCGAWRRRTCAW